MSFDTFVSWLKVCEVDGKSRGQKPFELSCNWLGIGSGQMCGAWRLLLERFWGKQTGVLICYDRYI